ncbi:Methylase of chemotaxis methyl-accepting proteins [Epsilonproteobacteria bacterium SCGC AD-311-C15]|nr:Methylase of chemotaxis methyl-accepting proteins [Epsilonproteobacteria bacterium SCGC AD-311-C15]
MSKNDIIVIGIGASAGGLEALQAFIQNLPASSNMAYIIAQHLSPTYKSLMVELLAKGTELEVLAATHGLTIKANTIYVCPPNENIFVEDDMILLSKPKSNIHGPKPSVDLFFESLAENKKEKSVGIILSGTGSDGSRGVRAIKASGGFTIVQDPQTAKYDGMPNSAINTGTIDLILTADKMGSELTDILSYVGKSIIPKSGSASTNVYKNILNKIKDVKGVDFNLYKPSTIERRIERRMVALKIVTLNDYHDFLVQNSGEPEALFKDILIGVTSFFRDGDSFSVLKNQLQEYLKDKDNTTIRIWAPGCSTGEEAYSLSMMISEILGAKIGHYKVQIFATDIDENALQYARKGLYQESALVGLDKTLRNRYFTIKSEHYEVIKPIREMVIFSRHNILRDPAFLRLDMIVCRNLLIYFSQELQKKLFPEFHYALNDNALLFLGKSESVGHFQSYFKTMDKKWKIYQSNFLGRKEPPPTVQSYERVDLINSTKIISELKKPTINDVVTDYVNEYIIPM